MTRIVVIVAAAAMAWCSIAQVRAGEAPPPGVDVVRSGSVVTASGRNALLLQLAPNGRALVSLVARNQSGRPWMRAAGGLVRSPGPARFTTCGATVEWRGGEIAMEEEVVPPGGRAHFVVPLCRPGRFTGDERLVLRRRRGGARFDLRLRFDPAV